MYAPDIVAPRRPAAEREPSASGRGAWLALVLVLGLPAIGGAGVVKDNLYAVKALSATEAWAVGNFGSIYHTADGGKSWELRESGTRAPLFGVDFADSSHGWIVGKGALVLHTADGGKTWTEQKSAIPAEKHLFNVAAIDAQTAWAIGDWGAIQVTHDGGTTWEDRSLGTTAIKVEESPARVTSTLTDDIILYDLSFPDAQHGFISGEFGTLLATGDGGSTWRREDVGTEKTLFGVGFSTPQIGWAVGIDGLIVHTGDGGRNWNVQHGTVEAAPIDELAFAETIKNPGLYDVEASGQHAVVVGDYGKVLVTDDGGLTWTPRELPEKQRLVWVRCVSLTEGNRGFVVGANGFAAGLERDKVVVASGGADAAASP